MERERRVGEIMTLEEKELEEKVQEIGGDDGFWKRSNEIAVRESIRELVQKGFTLEDAALFVEGLWVSAADEYGN